MITTTHARQRWSAGSRVSVCLLALAACLPLLAPPLEAKRPRQTALDRYVKTPDPTYHYTLASTATGTGYSASILEMTSQTWLTPAEVNRPIWTHWLTVIRPQTVKHPIALLFVTGGINDGKPPDRVNPLLADIAVATDSVVAELRMVPNQPLTFTDDAATPRREDAIIAYTWDKYLRTGDEKWPLRLPMTKAAVRAMDTVTDFCAKPEQGGQRIDRFVVAGASKRGWTTWTTAAVDPRVVAIAPMVIDALNVETSFAHHWRAYGFWAPAVKDYEDLQIMRWMGRPQFHALMAIEDPFQYRDRYTMPKFMINASGDQFFVPDSWQFYFNDLPGEKYLRYVPNADHSLKNSDAGESLGAFYSEVLTSTPRPQFSWTIDKSGTIRVKTTTTPTSVTVWRATNSKARDFRLESIGAAYRSTTLTEQEKGVYVATPAKPEQGWMASFVELRFPSATKFPLVFTTGVTVTPDTLPFDPPKSDGPPPPSRTSNQE